MKRIFAYFALAPVVALAQLDSYTVTVGASRNLLQSPDQVKTTITLTADETSGPDDVLAALKGTGVTLADLTGISSPPISVFSGPGETTNYQAMWSFSITVPLTSIGTTIHNLAALSKSIANSHKGWQLSYYLGGLTSASPLPCPKNQLIADAQARAVSIASAAGFGLGSILAVGDETEWQRLFGSPSGQILYAILSGFVSAESFQFASSPSTPPNCAIVVKFRLLPSF